MAEHGLHGVAGPVLIGGNPIGLAEDLHEVVLRMGGAGPLGYDGIPDCLVAKAPGIGRRPVDGLLQVPEVSDMNRLPCPDRCAGVQQEGDCRNDTFHDALMHSHLPSRSRHPPPPSPFRMNADRQVKFSKEPKYTETGKEWYFFKGLPSDNNPDRL